MFAIGIKSDWKHSVPRATFHSNNDAILLQELNQEIKPQVEGIYALNILSILWNINCSFRCVLTRVDICMLVPGVK